MILDFDRRVDRRGTNSIKWQLYGPDVLPLWVADMDFPAPEPILFALQRAVTHGVLGYEIPSKELRQTVADRMEALYGWEISPEAVVATPGVVSGFAAAARTVCAAGQGVLIQPPVYPPFLHVHETAALVRQDAPLQCFTRSQKVIDYQIDWEVFESALNSGGAHSDMFLLCNPHNPTGNAFCREELVRMAEICLRNGTVICSDEIHSELLLGGTRHIPLASLDPEIAARTITLIAPSKTFNVAGLFCGFAIIPDPDLCARYKRALERMTLHVNSLGLVAAESAFSGACDDWLAALLAYLTSNRDFAVGFLQDQLTGIRTTVPPATYLAWLDCNSLIESGRIVGSAHKYFLQNARVALNEGAEFGPGGQGFVRLNFGCPRMTLVEALDKMRLALVG
ncbi:MAG: PatB family C-S lyase [Anaerolineales bacterium]|nr:PatB family C-S lyase [Anaerolineales bacterium]